MVSSGGPGSNYIASRHSLITRMVVNPKIQLINSNKKITKNLLVFSVQMVLVPAVGLVQCLL